VEALFTVEHLVALVTLTALEIVLGIDNIVFIAILVGKLPKDQQPRARRLGLGGALVTRILLLLAIGWVMGLTREIVSIPAFWTSETQDRFGITGRDLILLVGGLFLIGKATFEIHDKLEGGRHERGVNLTSSFGAVIGQIMVLDIVFSLDSVITAVGMVRSQPEAAWVGLTIMISAVIIAVVVMLAFAGAISAFVDKHPTIKMLALSFLILIGVMLVVEGLHSHIPRGYIYFAMAFSLVVEILNIRMRTVSEPIQLRQSYVETKAPAPGFPK
jgi:predicted tellurium resistance membrane protein TerC